MYELVSHVPTDESASSFAVIRIADATGLGARWPGRAALINAQGAMIGQVFGGTLDTQLLAAVPPLLSAWPPLSGGSVFSVDLTEPDAVAAGLACAGRVTVLAQPVNAIPAATWAELRARRPTSLVTRLDAPELTTTAVLGDTVDSDQAGLIAELIRRGQSVDELIDTPEGRLLVSVFIPTPRLVVIGSGALVSALTAQVILLGWSAEPHTTVSGGVAAAKELGPGDGVLVIDHDGEVDQPILSQALIGGVGYVAALGSRRTQAARAGRLRDAGLPEDLIASLRGPAGLDIGARTPAEIAVAIVAEMLSVRVSAAGGALRDGAGSINRRG